MKHLKTAVIVGAFLMLFSAVIFAAQKIQQPPETDLVAIARDPAKENVVYAASERVIYKSCDYAITWKQLCKIKRSQGSVLALAVEEDKPNHVLAGTGRGVLESFDYGKTWKEGPVPLRRARVSSISYPYFVADGTLFRIEETQLRKIWGGMPAEKIENGDEEAAKEEEEARRIICVAFDAAHLDMLCAGTSRGVFESRDQGKTWSALPGAGLLEREISFILAGSGGGIIAVTQKGVFQYQYKKEEGRWEIILKDAPVNIIRQIAFANAETEEVLIVSDSGIHRLRLNTAAAPEYDAVLCEPDIREAQQAAVSYAEVSPEKIKKWRKRAHNKAFLPDVSVGYDWDKSNSYEIYTSANNNYYVSGPDDKSQGWNVRASWDLGDLIWSTDQTSIDVRSKLMVELRNDVLDELNRAYFERRRLQAQVAAGLPQNQGASLEKETRIQELTAQLDGLTGGWFSRECEVRKKIVAAQQQVLRDGK